MTYTDYIVSANEAIERADIDWLDAGELAPLATFRAHIEYRRDDKPAVIVMLADLSGVGYKDSMTVRAVRQLPIDKVDGFKAELKLLHDDLMIAKKRAPGVGVRRGF
jgi:hypothetical protein